MDALNIEFINRAIFTAVGLCGCFMGLWIYKSTLKIVGFLVGVACAGYVVFVLMTQSTLVIELPNLHFILLVIGILIVGGLLGSFLTRAFQYIVFFLAGGVIAVMLARMWAGEVNIQDFTSFENFRNALTDAAPQKLEIVIFFAGGLLYMINIGPIVALTTAALGAFCLRWAWYDILFDFGPNVPNILALAFGVVGTAVQLAAFRGKMDIIPPRLSRRGSDVI
jgi:hypothetical protein